MNTKRMLATLLIVPLCACLFFVALPTGRAGYAQVQLPTATFYQSSGGTFYVNGTSSVNGTQTQYDSGDVINLTVVPFGGYYFDHFAINGGSYASNPTYYMITSSTTFWAYLTLGTTFGSVVAITNATMAVRWQGKSFYAAGRYWIFYVENYNGLSTNGYNYGNDMYTSSKDDVTWATPINFYGNGSLAESTGENLQVILDSHGNINIFTRNTDGLYYGYATPESDGTLSWITPISLYWPLGSGSGEWAHTDYFATLDSNGFLWVSWEWGWSAPPGSVLYNMTCYVNKDEFNNGTWVSAPGFPMVVAHNYGTIYTMNGLSALSNGEMFCYYYSAGAGSIWGRMWNGTAFGNEETISTYLPYMDFPLGDETYGKTEVVDSSDNIWFGYVDQSNNIRVYERTNSTGTWNGGIVQSSVPDGASPAFVYYNGTLQIYWIQDDRTIDYKNYNYALGEWDANPSIEAQHLLNAIPADVGDYNQYDLNGRLNGFPSAFGSEGIGLLYLSNSTVQSNTLYQINFALLIPGALHDIGIPALNLPKTVVDQGYGANVTVTAADLGTYTETFNVTAYANTTVIASQNVTLSGGNSANVAFTWNTTGFDYGNYTLSAYAEPVLGETNTANNNCTGGMVIVTIPGDVNGDGTVDMKDIALVVRAFGSNGPNYLYPGSSSSSNWNPNADINNDGTVNMKDVALVARNFGQHYP